MDRFAPFTEPAAAVFHLPVARAPIIGRQRELALVAQLLGEGERLITLVGAGGVGKTRLALAIAEMHRAALAGRVGWVSLGELTDPDLLLDAIQRSLGSPNPGRDPIDALAGALGDAPALLVIDNMEHLAGASAMLSALLDRIPALSMLVTSRVPLRLTAEREVRIAPFPPVSDEDGQALLEAHPAIQLFVERARAVDASFDPDVADLGLMARIVAQLDYLPLAIELAAARVRHVSLEEIASLLSNPLDLLTGGPRDAPDRQRTIRAMIGWSYELLQPEEQQVFRAISVFPGPFTLDSAVALTECAGMSRLETIEHISALVDHNLLVRLNEPGVGRYVLLGSMRDFGQAQLLAKHEDEAVRSRFADAVIARVSPPEISPQDDVVWLGLIERSMDDVRAALSWLLAREDGVRALRLTASLAGWWNTRGNPREGHRNYAASLALSPDIASSQRFDALRDYSWLLALTGELPRALALREEVGALAETLGDPLSMIKAEQLLGALAFVDGNIDEGRARTQHAIELAEDADLVRRFRGLIFNLATLSEVIGDYELAMSYHRRGLELIEPGEERGLYALHQMGIASLSLRLDNPLDADRLVRAVWTDIAEVRNQQVILGALTVKGEVYLDFGEPARAARLFGAADKLIEAHGRVLTSTEVAEIEILKQRLAKALPPEALAQETATGRRLTLEEISAEIQLPVEPPGPSRSLEPSVLTPREIDVARLLVEGKTNPEIASALFISERTVQSHVANIMTKLGVKSRAAVAARVVRDNLTENWNPAP